MQFGVLHFAFGHFGEAWQKFDPLKSGSVAEITLLTDAPFGRPDQLTNHCIVTFGDTDRIEYEITYSSSSMESGNTVRCLVPDFMFKRAKQSGNFGEFTELLTCQVMAALDGLRFSNGVIAHFHSWECGFLTDSTEFKETIGAFKTIFSPYLTVGRLETVVGESNEGGWTMSHDELQIAAAYERKLSTASMRVVLESARDRDFYKDWVHADRLDVRSFAQHRRATIEFDASIERELKFLAGGRPVREKGFVELCRQFASVRDWAQSEGLEVSLAILCRDPRPEKGAQYLAELEATIEEHALTGIVSLEQKISLDSLLERIAQATALITPSLFDPFCLMPTYAVQAGTPAFVSPFAGASENIKSRLFIFDPTRVGDLQRAVAAWWAERPAFEYESVFPSYDDLYLVKESPEPWG